MFCSPVPTPSVTVTVHPRGPLNAGTTSVTLTCTITLSDDVDTDVMMEVTWFRSGTPLSNTNSRVTISPLAESGKIYTSNLILSPLSTEDSTDFRCDAVVIPVTLSLVTRSDTSSSTVSVSVESECCFLLGL